MNRRYDGSWIGLFNYLDACNILYFVRGKEVEVVYPHISIFIKPQQRGEYVRRSIH